MGRPKLVLPYGDGTVLEATVGALLAGGVERVVVVRAPGGPLEGWSPPAGVQVAVNERPEDGMLATIRVGLATLAEAGVAASPRGADPLLVCPADLPALAPATVAALLAEYRREPGLLVPSRGGRRGHPLLVPPRWQAEIAALPLAGGLRALLDRAGAELRHLPVDDPGAFHDVDTPAEYEALREAPR
jgi:CTP:molybdopterin cytidylyltransferase MocA